MSRRPPARSGRPESKAPASKAGILGPVPLIWAGQLLQRTGYGRQARGFLAGLAKLGVTAAARNVGGDSADFIASLHHQPDLALLLHRAMQTEMTASTVAVLHGLGGHMHRVSGAYATVGYTATDTDGLPAGWKERLNSLDEIWVPSSFHLETLEAAGITAPVEVLHPGVDTSTFRPGLPPLPVEGSQGCVFLAVLEWSPRGAPDALLRAWAQAFPPEAPVSLIIATGAGSDIEPESSRVTSDRVDAALAHAGLAREGVAPIVTLAEIPTLRGGVAETALARLLSTADVLVDVSRGQAPGGVVLEAMACALPVIATRWGAALDMLDDTNSLLVDVAGLIEADDPLRADLYSGQRWADPSADHLASLLQRAAADARLRESLGKRARSEAEQRWQWHQVAKKVKIRIEELSSPSYRPHQTATEAATDGQDAGVARVRWTGEIFSDHSLATVNRELVSRLALLPELAIETFTPETPPHPPEYVEVLERAGVLAHAPRRGPVAVELRLSWPPNFAPTISSKLGLILPWEFGGLPEAWVEKINDQVDELWALTSWLKDCFVRSGVEAERIGVVPCGVDTATFRPEGPTFPLRTKKKLKFLFVGGTIFRKGFDLLLSTYLSAFDRDDDVCLVVKTFGGDGVYKHFNMDDALRSAAANPANPEIELVDQRLSRQQLAALYRSCDVLVHAYRGEGFAMTVAEAMACGLPTVTTGYGACLDFVDADTAWLIDAVEVPVQMTDLPPPCRAGYWIAQPDASHLRDHMLAAASSESERKSKGSAGRDRILAGFTWDHAAEKAHHRLEELISRSVAGRRS